MRVLKPSHFVRSTAMLIVCSGVAAAAVVTAAVSTVPSRIGVSEQPVAREAPLATIAEQLSLTERHMAVADLSSQMRATVQTALGEHVQREWPALQALLQSRDAAARSAPASAEPSPSSLPAAQRAVAQWYNAARAAALAEVPEGQRQLLQRLHDNRATALPIEFRVETYTQAEVVALRDALSEKQRRAELGDAADSAGAELVSRYETATVLAARQRLVTVP